MGLHITLTDWKQKFDDSQDRVKAERESHAATIAKLAQVRDDWDADAQSRDESRRAACLKRDVAEQGLADVLAKLKAANIDLENMSAQPIAKIKPKPKSAPKPLAPSARPRAKKASPRQ